MPGGSTQAVDEDHEPLEMHRSKTERINDIQSFLRGGHYGAEKKGSKFAEMVLSQRFEAFGGCVVIVNFLIITFETHARAENNKEMLVYIADLNRFLLAYYFLECAARVYVLRTNYFLGLWNILDLVIVATGLVSEAMESIMRSSAGVDQLAMLKSLRMARLLRLVRLLVAFRELYVLLAGLGRCMKTLLWACGLIFLVLNVWAIISVEYLQGYVQELAAEGAFGSCIWCGEAFGDVWKANLTWFQVMSGDGWSALGRPLAEKHPWTYLLFVSNIAVMVWGLLNIVVAAIVDSSIQAREEDVQGAARAAVRARNLAFESFRNLCEQMDKDGDGEVTTEEFIAFKQTSTELQQHLEVMGVSDDDFEKCLKLMDVDGDGVVDFDEFAQEFTRMRSLVIKTNLYHVLRHVERLQERVIEMQANDSEMLKLISNLGTGSPNNKDAIPNASVDTLCHGGHSSFNAQDLALLASAASAQAKSEQLSTDWEELHGSTAATLARCEDLSDLVAGAVVVEAGDRIEEPHKTSSHSRGDSLEKDGSMPNFSNEIIISLRESPLKVESHPEVLSEKTPLSKTPLAATSPICEFCAPNHEMHPHRITP